MGKWGVRVRVGSGDGGVLWGGTKYITKAAPTEQFGRIRIEDRTDTA